MLSKNPTGTLMPVSTTVESEGYGLYGGYGIGYKIQLYATTNLIYLMGLKINELMVGINEYVPGATQCPKHSRERLQINAFSITKLIKQTALGSLW